MTGYVVPGRLEFFYHVINLIAVDFVGNILGHGVSQFKSEEFKSTEGPLLLNPQRHNVTDHANHDRVYGFNGSEDLASDLLVSQGLWLRRSEL